MIVLLNKLLAALTGRTTTGQQLLYAISGRDGHIIYKDTQGEITFYFEFGGGNTIAMISVPKVHAWAKETKRPLTERDAILHYTAQQAIKDQAPGCNYRLLDGWIEIYKD